MGETSPRASFFTSRPLRSLICRASCARDSSFAMNTQPSLHRTVRELFPDVSEELSLLLDGAVENSGLLASDYMTVRDLLELSDYAHEEPLHVLLLVLLTALDEGSLCVEVSEERLTHRLASLASAARVRSWPSRNSDPLA